MEDIIYWSLIHKIWGIRGNKILLTLMSKMSGREFWNISPNVLQKDFLGISQEMAELFYSEKSRINIENEVSKLTKLKVKIISILDPHYPQSLKNIYSPPPIIYLRGKLPDTSLRIAIVGSRKASPYGKKIALQFARELSINGVQIISGLARGIDTCGHKGALEGKGGTIAVLGSGIDVVYPRENLELYEQIINAGHSGVISEFPMGTNPQKFYFPLRNRIISGLADGILVIEAGEKSGSLITAEFALEQGKDVFAVPGPVDSSFYKGSHGLIKDGAKLVDSIDDILEEYGQLTLFREKPLKNNRLDTLEKKIFFTLSWEPKSLEDIIMETKLSPQEVLTALSLLEIKGYIKEVAGRKYISLNWGD
ncbi:MAG: DNA-protecting protein DprA [Clostridia bacterium]|nr:DNA-protecting protein DprA [Clostridia bacterium]